jgi:hypothetical protein
VHYRADEQGGYDHSSVISLLDVEGNITFQQVGAQASSKELLDQLEAMRATPRL